MGERRRHAAHDAATGAPRAGRGLDRSIRPFANRIFQFGLSELSLVVLLGVAWVSPQFVEAVRPGFIANLPILFLAEFILGHASVGLVMPLIAEGVVRWLLALFIGLLYAGFFYALFLFGNGIQVTFFLWITLARVYRAERGFQKGDFERVDRGTMVARLAGPPLLRVFYLLLCLAISQVIPIPQLGLSWYSGPTVGSGALVDHPERTVFLLMLYFASIPWLERTVFPKVTRLFAR